MKGMIFINREEIIKHRKALFEKEAPMPAKEQKQTFGEVLEQTVGDECSLRLVSSIHAQINQIIEENKADKEEELPFITKADIQLLLSICNKKPYAV